MSELSISLKTFKKRLKIRYPLLTVVFIFSFLIIPIFFPYDSDYSPVNSFSNKDGKGHSQLKQHLDNNFNTFQEHLDITKSYSPTNSLIVIISPQRYFTDFEINFLDDWTNQGGHLIIGGTSKHVKDLVVELDIDIDISNSKIVDFQTSFENANFVPISLAADPQITFTAIAPLSIDSNIDPFSATKIITSPSAEKASCVEFDGVSCSKVHSIGYIQNNANLALFLDNWLLRNFIIDESPQNLLFIENIINIFGGNIENIIFDESHYNWAPLNKKGVEALINNLTKSQFYPPVIFLFSVVFPLLLVLMNGNFNKSKMTGISPVSQKLKDRIDRLYLDQIIAVPLSLEEQVLVEENLELIARNKYYFQYVASYYLDIIDQKELKETIPSELIDSLNFMKHEVFDKQTAWELIKIINYYLDSSSEGNKTKRS